MQVGDVVTRMLAGTVPMQLRVVKVEHGVVTCGGGWTFDLNSGAEIDEDLGWGPPPMMTGSYIVLGEDA